MAITASCAASPTTTVAGPDGAGVSIVLTVSNSAGAAVDVIGVNPKVYPAGTVKPTASAVVAGSPLVGGVPVSIPAGGSVTFQWFQKFHAPQVLGVAGGAPGPASNLQYDCGAEVTAGEGSIVQATVVTVTVNASPHS